MQAENSKLKTSDNYFFSDPILFQTASQLDISLLPSFSDLGDYTASIEADERARLAHRHLPMLNLYNQWGELLEDVDIHPAYHSLLTRSRAAGIAGSLYEDNPEEEGKRAQTRMMRLFLLGGLETGHLQELCISSAGLGALRHCEELYEQWQPQLASPMHDPARIAFPRKEGASISLAIQELASGKSTISACTAKAEAMYEDGEGADSVFRISGEKIRVINPVADGFLVSAVIKDKPCLFLVPRLLGSGQLNGISLRPAIQDASILTAPFASMIFEQSAGWLVAKEDQFTTIINEVFDNLGNDNAVVSASIARSAMRVAVDLLRMEKENGKENIFYGRMLADAALDCAALTVLTLRLGQSIDIAAQNEVQVVWAELLRPVVAYWSEQLARQITDCAITTRTNFPLQKGERTHRGLRFFARNRSFEKTPNDHIQDFMKAVKKYPDHFENIIIGLAGNIGSAGPRTAEVLQVAAKMAVNDSGSAFLLMEQFAYTAAAAALSRLDIDMVANAFVESRLGGQWRSTYGMMSPRFNATFILEALYPSA